MNPKTIRLTVTDPVYKGRVLAIHRDLAPAEAKELRGAYRGLGYPARNISESHEETAAQAA
jgi:hypothetical protein